MVYLNKVRKDLTESSNKIQEEEKNHISTQVCIHSLLLHNKLVFFHYCPYIKLNFKIL